MRSPRFRVPQARGVRPSAVVRTQRRADSRRARPIDLAELKKRLLPLGEVRANPFALRFLQAAFEITVFADGRAIVKGTTDPGVARGIYARYVGH